MKSGFRSLEVWSLESGVRILESGLLDSESLASEIPGVLNLESGVRNLECGLCKSEVVRILEVWSLESRV